MTICGGAIIFLFLLLQMIVLKTTSSKTGILEKADWMKFEILCSGTILVENFENQADPIQKFTETLTCIANKCINPSFACHCSFFNFIYNLLLVHIQ